MSHLVSQGHALLPSLRVAAARICALGTRSLIAFVLLLSLIVAHPARAATSSELDLLDKLQEWFSQYDTVEFQATLVERIRGGFFADQEREIRRETIECLRDDERWRILARLESWIRVADGRATEGVAGSETEFVADGKLRTNVQRDLTESRVVYGMRVAFSNADSGMADPVDYLHESAFVFGRLFHNLNLPLVEVLRASDTRIVDSVSQNVAELAGARLLEGRGPYGKIVAWVDPRDGALLRLSIEKQGSDRTGGNRAVNDPARSPVGGLYPAEQRRSLAITVDEIQLREDDERRPMESFRIVHETGFERGGPVRSAVTVRLSKMELPEAIADDQFRVRSSVPDGTRVLALGNLGVDYEWRGGALSKVINTDSARRQAEVTFKRGVRSPWYLAGIVTLVLIVLALVGYRIYAERAA